MRPALLKRPRQQRGKDGGAEAGAAFRQANTLHFDRVIATGQSAQDDVAGFPPIAQDDAMLDIGIVHPLAVLLRCVLANQTFRTSLGFGRQNQE